MGWVKNPVAPSIQEKLNLLCCQKLQRRKWLQPSPPQMPPICTTPSSKYTSRHWNSVIHHLGTASPPVASKDLSMPPESTNISVQNISSPNRSRTTTAFKFTTWKQSSLKPPPNTVITLNGESENIHSLRPKEESHTDILRKLMEQPSHIYFCSLRSLSAS